MALAEAGYPDACVMADGPTVAIDADRVPAAVSWRAAAVAGARCFNGMPLPCLACWIATPTVTPDQLGRGDASGPTCLARGEGIEDCGADRSAA
jgi:hypothetical protein